MHATPPYRPSGAYRSRVLVNYGISLVDAHGFMDLPVLNKVLALLNEAVQQDPSNENALFTLGKTYFSGQMHSMVLHFMNTSCVTFCRPCVDPLCVLYRYLTPHTPLYTHTHAPGGGHFHTSAHTKPQQPHGPVEPGQSGKPPSLHPLYTLCTPSVRPLYTLCIISVHPRHTLTTPSPRPRHAL